MRRQNFRSERQRKINVSPIDDQIIKAILHCPELIKEDKLPKMRIKKIEIEIPSRQTRFRSNKLLSKLREQTAMVNALWPLQEEANRKLELEVTRLNNRLHELESEAIEIKCKRWCRICTEDAQYMSATSKLFYCSLQCELRHMQLATNDSPAFTKEPESESS